MKTYKTDLKCPICSSELVLIEDVYYNDFDGDVLKDSEFYFECKNDCDSDIINSISGFDDIITKIIEENNVKGKQLGLKS